MKYNVVALDIDGTLLNDQHQLLFENIIVIRKLVEAGVCFILVTGRPDVMATTYSDKLGINPIILGYNGATIRNVATKEIFYSKFLDIDSVKSVCAFLEQENAYYRIYCMDCVYSFNQDEFDDDKNIYAQFSRNLKNMMDFKILNTWEELKEPVVKVVVFSEDTTNLNYLRDKLKVDPKLSVVFGSRNGVDINATGINKGQALLDYGAMFGIDASAIIAIGDSENDLSMLEVVGMPITLESGDPILRKYVKFVTKSNNEAGVAYALKEMFAEEFMKMYQQINLFDQTILFYGEQDRAKELIKLTNLSISYEYFSGNNCLDKNSIIVVVAINQENYIKELLDQNFVYGEHFILEDDFLSIVNSAN